jgi:DNA-binding NarL/FixJ family response regulator
MPVRTTPIQVALVEDDVDIREHLAHQLNKDGAFSLLWAYSDAESALSDLPSRQPEVVLMDINLPGMDGVECVRQLKVKMPAVHVIMLTVYEDGNRLFRSLMAGASGYLLKNTPPDKLLNAIREVCNGGAPMTPEIARRVVQYFRHLPQEPTDLAALAPLETQVLDQLSKGYRYKEITTNLGITLGTLHWHISKIYEKLRVHSRTEAVVKYLNG